MTDFSIVGWRTSNGEILVKDHWIWIDVPDRGPGVGKFSGIFENSLGPCFKLYHFRFELDPSFKNTWIFRLSRGNSSYAALLAARIVAGPLKPGQPNRGTLQ